MNYPILSQRDPRWGNKLLGTSKSSTIHMYGCLLTCFTMLSGWDNPLDMNASRIAHGGFTKGSYASTFDISASEPKVHLVSVGNKQHKFDALPQADCQKVMNHLEAGNPIILEVNWNARFDRSAYKNLVYFQHFVLLLPGLIIHDPWIWPGQNDQVSPLTVYAPTLSEAGVRPIYYTRGE